MATATVTNPRASSFTAWWWVLLTLTRTSIFPAAPMIRASMLLALSAPRARAGGGDVLLVRVDAVAGQVLDQGAAEGDVKRLQATADAEDRKLAPGAGADQLDLEPAPLRLLRPRPGAGSSP